MSSSRSRVHTGASERAAPARLDDLKPPEGTVRMTVHTHCSQREEHRAARRPSPKAHDVWGDTAYRSRANERLLAENGRRSQIHRKKPPRKPMPKHTARANGAKSKVRAAVEHVFAHEKGPMGLVVRTIGLARARVKIGLANLVYNMKRTIWLTGRLPPA